MKPLLLASCLSLLGAPFLLAQAEGEGAPALDDFKNRLSYIIGTDMGESYKRQTDLDLDSEAFLAGIRDVLNGKESRISPALKAEVMQELELSRLPAEQQEIAKANLAKGATFLAENGKREGVKTTDTGLQYEVMTAGDEAGTNPKATDTVTVHYHGTLLDGTVFDSSVDRGETIEFPLNRVIPGWTEGVQLMKPGSKYKFFIPSRLAYGLSPRPGGPIKPGDALIFEVELFKVGAAPQPPAGIPRPPSGPPPGAPPTGRPQ